MSKKPNLVFMFADQLRLCSTGYYGDKNARTPNIDKLSEESCNLCNAVSGHPVCAPYRASLLTGKYTTSTGMVINEIRISPNHRSFAHVIKDNGYSTSYIGKWHMYANEWGNHDNPKNSFIPQGPDRLGFDEYFASYNFHHENYGPRSYYHLNTPEKLSYNGYEPDCQTDMAIDQLKTLSASDKPFALFLSVGTPHDPWEKWNVPEEYFEMFKNVDFSLPENYLAQNDKYADDWAKLSPDERKELTEWMRVYYAMVANVDYNVGKMTQAINNLGIADNTIFIFTSDHGELFGAHGRRAKNIFYEESVRIPFLIRWGDKISYTQNDVCLNTVDIMPTLLSMMGMKDDIPQEVEGKDLSDCILGKKNAYQPEGALMMGTGATAKWEDGHEWRAFRTKKFTYATYLVDGSELLFDNENDPYQMNNLINNAEYADVLVSIKKLMADEMLRINDKFHPSSYYEKNWTKDRIIYKTKAD